MIFSFNVRKVIPNLLMFLLLLILACNMFNSNLPILFFQQILKAIVFIIYIYDLIKRVFIPKARIRLIRLIFIFSTLILFYSIFSEYFMMIFSNLNVLLALPYFYYKTLDKEIDIKKFKLFLWLYVLISILSYLYLYRLRYELYSDEISLLGAFNLGYTILLVFPVVFLLKPNIKTILMSFTIVSLVFFSRKRGAIISSLLPFFIYLYYVFFRDKVSALRRLFYQFVMIILLCALVYILISNLEFIIGRFYSSGSSGRNILYSLIFYSWFDSTTLLHLLFGYGFYSTFDLTKDLLGYSLYAHSDFLEVLYDYGILGISIYFLIIRELLINIYTKRRVPEFNVYYCYCSCVLIFIVKAVVSGTFLDVDCNILYIMIGFCIARMKMRMY